MINFCSKCFSLIGITGFSIEIEKVASEALTAVLLSSMSSNNLKEMLELYQVSFVWIWYDMVWRETSKFDLTLLDDIIECTNVVRFWSLQRLKSRDFGLVVGLKHARTF